MQTDTGPSKRARSRYVTLWLVGPFFSHSDETGCSVRHYERMLCTRACPPPRHSTELPQTLHATLVLILTFRALELYHTSFFRSARAYRVPTHQVAGAIAIRPSVLACFVFFCRGIVEAPRLSSSLHSTSMKPQNPTCIVHFFRHAFPLSMVLLCAAYCAGA